MNLNHKKGDAEFRAKAAGAAVEADISALKPGEKLRIEHLRDKYQFGASGIREALSRLISDGLVDSEAQRGFWVAQIRHGSPSALPATSAVTSSSRPKTVIDPRSTSCVGCSRPSSPR